MMKTIYQRAGLVIIWLGEELTTDLEALRLAIDIRNFVNGNQEVPVDISVQSIMKRQGFLVRALLAGDL
jgi:hypothetical protein